MHSYSAYARHVNFLVMGYIHQLWMLKETDARAWLLIVFLLHCRRFNRYHELGQYAMGTLPYFIMLLN